MWQRVNLLTADHCALEVSVSRRQVSDSVENCRVETWHLHGYMRPRTTHNGSYRPESDSVTISISLYPAKWR